MGIILNHFERKIRSSAFGSYIDAILESPHQTGHWYSLIDRLLEQAASGPVDNEHYAQMWHEEVMDTYRKAMEYNPENIALQKSYSRFLRAHHLH